MGIKIDGRLIASRLKQEMAERVASSDRKPIIAGILVGGGEADEVYVRMREKTAIEIGAASVIRRMDRESSTRDVIGIVEMLNDDSEIQGIIVHQPLPGHVDSEAVSRALFPGKDVEGMHPFNLGLLMLGQETMAPATPAAVVHILEYMNIPLQGREVVVVSHSNIVGKPLSAMLLNRDATLHVCHVYTEDLSFWTKKADVLITAAGVPGLVDASMIREGAVVIDVSMNASPDGLCGDIIFQEVLEKASMATPVPGGVGPVTNAVLFKNLLDAMGV